MPFSLDANHADIVNAFRDLGGAVYVVDNAKVERQEKGQLDLWVGIADPFGGTGVWVWVEVKTSSGKLRPEQASHIRECEDRGLPVEVARSTADVQRIYEKYLAIMAERQGE